MKYKYDIFLAHNDKNKHTVRRFGDRLRSVNLKPFLDVDELIPGANRQNDLKVALENSRLTAVFISPNNISPWEEAEMQIAINQQRADVERRVIPVLLPGKYEPNIPGFLELNTWVDFRETDIEDDETFSRLLAGIWGITPRKARERFTAQADAMPAPEAEDSDPDALPDPGPKGGNWRLPFARNASFTGRAGELRQLGEMLLNEGKQSVVITQSIVGMGGIGKTQLAVEFCYRYGNQFDGVYWLDARNPESIERELYECGYDMGLYGKDQVVELEIALKDVLATWAGGRPLVVLDNLESEQGLQDIMERLNSAGELAVLLTARKQAWPKRLVPHTLPLRAFTKDEARTFLRGELESERYPDADLDALAERLGYHPLALYLAMNYLMVHALPIGSYLERLQNAINDPSQDATQWTDDLSSATGYDLNLHHALNLSWEAVDDELARTLFKLAAWCAPNAAIPPELLLRVLQKAHEPDDITILQEIAQKTQSAPAEEQETLFNKLMSETPGAAEMFAQWQAAQAMDEAVLGKAVHMLANVGLLRGGETGPKLHPLLCEYGQMLDDVDHSHLDKMADALIEQSIKANNYGLPTQVAPFQPHLENLAPMAESQLPAKATVLWNELGLYLMMIAGYTQAAKHFQDALEIDRSTFGEQHERVAIRLNNLGGALEAMGDLPAATQHYERALAIHRAVLGNQHPYVAIDLNNLGGALKGMGDLDAAIEHFNQALAIDRASFGEQHPKVATRLNNLGGTLQAMGDLPAAVEHYTQVIAIFEHNQMIQHPYYAGTLNNLGLLLGEMGDRETACAHLRQALAIWEATLPVGHPYIESVKEGLAGYGCDEG